MIAALGVVGQRIIRWLAAAAALVGLFWFSNWRAKYRGEKEAEQRAAEQANHDAIEALRTREKIDRKSRDGDSRDRLRERLRRRQEG